MLITLCFFQFTHNIHWEMNLRSRFRPLVLAEWHRIRFFFCSHYLSHCFIHFHSVFTQNFSHYHSTLSLALYLTNIQKITHHATGDIDDYPTDATLIRVLFSGLKNNCVGGERNTEASGGRWRWLRARGVSCKA